MSAIASASFHLWGGEGTRTLTGGDFPMNLLRAEAWELTDLGGCLDEAATVQASARTAEPAQPGLLGIEPAPDIGELRLSLIGHVHRRPEVRLTPDGRHGHLVLQIDQPPHAGHAGYPLAVTYSVDEPDIPAIQRLAAQLIEPGALALCVCRGLDVDDARRQLRPRHCDRIVHIARAAAGGWLLGASRLHVAHPAAGDDPSMRS